MVSILTPSESNVYSKLVFRLPYDSFGVERVLKRINFYKHAIPLGLGFQKIHKLFILSDYNQLFITILIIIRRRVFFNKESAQFIQPIERNKDHR